MTEFEKILKGFKLIPRHTTTKTFMEIAGYPHYENVCSNILKFYLDPHNEHGLKNLVLNSLLHLVNKDFEFDTDNEKIEIYREYITKKNNRLDLLILTNEYAIGIENKIFHHLHNDLSDYYTTVESCATDKKTICIVLSLNKLNKIEDTEKLKENHFVNITYEQLFENIKKSIGQYIGNSNIKYVTHLTDFIKTMENFNPTTMENKELFKFIKTNATEIQELTKQFSVYINALNSKITVLKDTMQNKPKADKQWICNKNILVHDYIVDGKYKVAVDTVITINGWEIRLFGRNSESSNFIINTMCKSDNFLPKSFNSFDLPGNRLTTKKIDTDAPIEDVASVLEDLLNSIENYNSEGNKNVVTQES